MNDGCRLEKRAVLSFTRSHRISIHLATSYHLLAVLFGRYELIWLLFASELVAINGPLLHEKVQILTRRKIAMISGFSTTISMKISQTNIFGIFLTS